MQIACKCGCGETFTPSKATSWRLKRGDDVGFRPGHHIRGQRNPRWNKRQSSKGDYILVWLPDHPNARKSGYILEHRLRMSEHLGRPLHVGEVVHHMNDRPADNRLENLQVMPRPEHARMHGQGQRNPNAAPPLTPKICPTCGQDFIKRWRGNHARDTFCSRDCIRGKGPKGERHPLAILNDELVRLIRVRAAAGDSATSIAASLGLNRRNVSRVIDGTRWGHVE